MNKFLRVLSVTCAAMLTLALLPSQAAAQTQSVSVTDTRNTERSIRTIVRLGDAAELGLVRLGTNVDVLLNRLSVSGADDTRLQNVAAYYQRSATAARFRVEARITAEANKQLLKLRAKANSEDLIADLEEARDLAIAEVVAAQTETLDGIDASLESVLVAP